MKAKASSIIVKTCPLEYAVNTISGKWKVPIIWRINEGEKRPSEFLRGIAKVDRRVLNQQLKELEAAGILSKISFNELPPRVEYSLTGIGEKLVEVLWSLNAWGAELLAEKGEAANVEEQAVSAEVEAEAGALAGGSTEEQAANT